MAEEFIKRFMTPRLADLAHHPSANFTLQAALAAAPSKDMVSGLAPCARSSTFRL